MMHFTRRRKKRSFSSLFLPTHTKRTPSRLFLASCIKLSLNSQAKILGEGELEEVSDDGDGGLAGNKGLGELEFFVSICLRGSEFWRSLPAEPAGQRPFQSPRQPQRSARAWCR